MAFDDIFISYTGRATKNAEVKSTKNGNQYLKFTLAHTVSHKDNNTGKYVDDYTIFMPCKIWGRPAQNAGGSIRKGDLVTVTGTLRKDPDYQDKNTGEQKDGPIFIAVSNCGMNTKYDPAHSERQPGNQGFSNQNQGGGFQSGGYQSAPPQYQQPPAPSNGGFSFDNNYGDEPPF